VRIIDRYLLRQFLVPLAFCFAAFTMLYIVFDLFNNLGDFLQGRASLGSLVRYYLLMIPASLIYSMPVSLILAVLWSMSLLTRHNELTAMRACGISLVRLMTPLFVVGVIASLTVLVLNETIGSEAAYQTRQFVRAQSREDKDSVYIAGPLPYQNSDAHRSWLIRRFDTRTFEMEDVRVTQQSPAGRDIWRATAARGIWAGGGWWLQDLWLQYFDETGNPVGAPRTFPVRHMIEFDERPQDFLQEVKEPEFLGAAELVRFIRSHPELSPAAVRRLTVDLHSRLALPWGCLVAVLFGVPFGTTTGRKGAVKGVMLCLALFFSSWAAVSLGMWASKKGLLRPAWLGGWGPTLVYLAAGATLALRNR